MKWFTAMCVMLGLTAACGVGAQTQGPAPTDDRALKPIALPINVPGSLSREAKPANAPANPIPGIPRLNYPTLDYAPQIPPADTTSLLGLPTPPGTLAFAPAQIQTPRALELPLLTLPSNALAPRSLEMLPLPVLSFAPQSSAPAAPSAPAVPLRDRNTPAFYLPSPVVTPLAAAPLPQLTVAYLATPLQAETAQPGVYAAPTETQPQVRIPTNLIALGAAVLGAGIPGIGAFGANVEGIWRGLGNILPGMMGQTPQPTIPNPTPPQPTVPQPNIPSMRY